MAAPNYSAFKWEIDHYEGCRQKQVLTIAAYKYIEYLECTSRHSEVRHLINDMFYTFFLIIIPLLVIALTSIEITNKKRQMKNLTMVIKINEHQDNIQIMVINSLLIPIKTLYEVYNLIAYIC